MTTVDSGLLNSFRSRLEPSLSEVLSDLDCSRFLVARGLNVDKAVVMVVSWWEWRNAELPGSKSGVTPANILIATANDNLLTHPSRALLPHALHGEDREGRPIYWEKTGQISSNFNAIKEVWTVDDLIQMHIRSMELTVLRCELASKKYGRPITKSVVVLDLTSINMMPDLQAISYSRRQITLDQSFYPETLHRFFIINAPWFFTAIFALISPFMDAITKDKIRILGSDFLPTLLECIDISEIPVELGGQMVDTPFTGTFIDRYGCSDEQVAEKVASMTIRDDSKLEELS